MNKTYNRLVIEKVTNGYTILAVNVGSDGCDDGREYIANDIEEVHALTEELFGETTDDEALVGEDGIHTGN